MLTLAGLIILEILALFILSRLVIAKLYTLFFLISRSRPFAVSAVTLLTFPGTIIHELSHLFTAEILGVRTGKLTLSPESIREPEIKAGSVMIQQTDPFRRTAIGTAPITGGIITLTTLAWFLMPNVNMLLDTLTGGALPAIREVLLALGAIYLMFAVSNSMFSSKEDLKGAWAVFILLGIIAGAAYYLGLRLTVSGFIENIATRLLRLLSESLLVVLLLNLIILITTTFKIWLIGKIFKVRVNK